MKICFLAHAASIHTRRWTQYFVRQGHRVSVVSFSPSNPIDSVDLHLLTSRIPISHERSNWQYFFQLLRLRKTLREIDPDIVYAQFLSSYGFMGSLVNYSDRPFVIRLQGSDILTIAARSPLHSRIAKHAISRSDLLISVAQHMTDRLREYNRQNVPVMTLQYGIDIDSFVPPPEQIERDAICFSNRNMVPNSNLEILIRAALILREKGSPISFQIAGDGKLRRHLVSLVALWNLHQNIVFMGHLDHQRMPSHLQEAAIFVSIVSSDGTPLSLIEAMACGAFPVVSDIPANREWIEDGVNGILVPLGSAENLADKLQKAWQEKEMRQEAAAINRQIILERADYEVNMAKIERAFIDLVEKKSLV